MLVGIAALVVLVSLPVTQTFPYIINSIVMMRHHYRQRHMPFQHVSRYENASSFCGLKPVVSHEPEIMGRGGRVAAATAPQLQLVTSATAATDSRRRSVLTRGRGFHTRSHISPAAMTLNRRALQLLLVVISIIGRRSRCKRRRAYPCYHRSDICQQWCVRTCFPQEMPVLCWILEGTVCAPSCNWCLMLV